MKSPITSRLLVLGLLSFLLSCQSDNKPNPIIISHTKNKTDSLVYIENVRDCNIFLELLKKGCVKRNAHLNIPTLKQVIILVPSNKYEIDCDKFSLEEIKVSVVHQLVNFDILKKSFATPKDSVKTLYLLNYKHYTNSKFIELVYSPSGSRFTIKIQRNETGWFIKDLFCSQF